MGSRKTIIIAIFFSLILVGSLSTVVFANSTSWNKEYPSLEGRGRSIIKTEDGGYAIAGESEGHFLLLKINSFGELQWFKKYEVGSAYSIVQTSEGGYVLAGSGSIYNFFKTDSSGNIQWNWTYPHLLRSLTTTSDGGYALVGHHGSLNIAESALIVKTDENGNKQWDKFYGNGMSYFLSIVEANEGGFAITGVINQQGLLIKTDYNGNILWNKTYSETRCLIKTKDGGYMFCLLYTSPSPRDRS